MDKSYLKGIVKDIFWSVYGITVRNPPLPSDIRSILFVCLGNICRSPFAERIAAKQSDPSNGIAFASAGIRVDKPRTPPMEAISVAKTFGIDMHDHVSRNIGYNSVESYDLIVVMEAWQYKYLRKLFLEFQNKIILLPVFGSDNKIFQYGYDEYNIMDPFGKKASDYDKCFEKIRISIRFLLNNIKK